MTDHNTGHAGHAEHIVSPTAYFIVYGALLALVGSSARQLSASLPKAPVWLSDYDSAARIARESGKPLFVAFR